MRNRTISVLGPATLVLLVMGLALWVVSQLTDSGAAAERLPVIIVGASDGAAQAETPDSDVATPADSAGSVGTSQPTTASSTTVPPVEGSAGQGTQATTPPTSVPATGSQGGSITTTVRIVVPDPVRELDRGRPGSRPPGGTSTGGTGAGSSGAGGSTGPGTAGR
ncbi:MAG: hypothetical protein KKA32_01775 [Actinobacteria bacterium]|nr:hypothetical protein [Actinomycetota bacterium]